MEALAKFGQEAADLVVPLLEQERPLKLKAFMVLEALGARAAPARAAILKVAADADVEMRLAAIPCLAAIGANAELLGLLESDPEPKVRASAGLFLSHRAKGDQRVAKALVRATAHAGTRQDALIALGILKVKNPEVVASVLAGLREKELRITAIGVARDLALQEAVEPLAKPLEIEETGVPALAAEALGAIGPAASAALPALKALLARTRDAWSRSRIELAIRAVEKK